MLKISNNYCIDNLEEDFDFIYLPDASPQGAWYKDFSTKFERVYIEFDRKTREMYTDFDTFQDSGYDKLSSEDKALYDNSDSSEPFEKLMVLIHEMTLKGVLEKV